MIALRSSSSTPANLNHRPRAVLTTTSEIDLGQPFEQILAMVLSLPPGCTINGAEPTNWEAELKEVIRCLYEAANGRQAETHIGMVAIAPPVAPFLKNKPLQAATQIDFLINAATCILCGPARRDPPTPVAEHFDQTLVSKRDRPNGRSKRAVRPARRASSSSLQVSPIARTKWPPLPGHDDRDDLGAATG